MAVPAAVNEPVRSYAPGSPERAELESRLGSMAQSASRSRSSSAASASAPACSSTSVMPHAHGHVLADWHRATPELVEKAIAAARQAQREWASWPWEDRAAVFLKAAELLATTWRSTINAATMLGQSKTVHQAEIDAACELIDFCASTSPSPSRSTASSRSTTAACGTASTTAPLEGFVYAITPFNFTAIGGNLSTAPALMGNTVLWKPAATRDAVAAGTCCSCSRRPGCRRA